MTVPQEIEQGIESLLAEPPYGVEPQRHHDALLAVLKNELQYASLQNPRYANYLKHWPLNFRGAERIADLPYLPVRIFKSNPPLALVGANEIKRTLASSATTGQVPSRVVLDAQTARRMTKGVIAIIRDFIGPARRSYLVIDTPENLKGRAELGARGAAIQALSSFATEVVCCLEASEDGDVALDFDKLIAFAEKWKDSEVLVYGFTYVIWTQLVQPLQRRGITLNLRGARVLHSGGWKRLEHEAVTRDTFARGVASVFGCLPNRIVDYYGMVENVGVVYPDCEYGNKHVPSFAEVIVRDPLTLAPVTPGQRGLIQVCSALPTSFPGFLLLTEDLAQVVGYDDCPCGRRGVGFRFAGRVPKAEVRGCGNLESTRSRQAQEVGVA